jgi:hypothetical protein
MRFQAARRASEGRRLSTAVEMMDDADQEESTENSEYYANNIDISDSSEQQFETILPDGASPFPGARRR